MRGSISRAYDLPLIVILMATFSIVAVSGIEMRSLDLFPPGAAYRNADGFLDQCSDERALVVRRSAHIGLWIGGDTSSFRCGGDGLVIETMSAKRRFGFSSADRRKTDTTERDGGIFAGLAVHGQLNSGTRCWINRRGALECEIGSATTLRRNHGGAESFGRGASLRFRRGASWRRGAACRRLL